MVDETGTRDDARLDEVEQLLADVIVRRAAGEDVALETLIRSRPELASELREMWSQLAAVERALEDDAGRASRERTQVEAVLRAMAGAEGVAERYVFEGEIGRGGMGAVLRVQDRKLARPLAMKRIVGESSVAGKTPPVEPRRLARFLNEARITSQLEHPGIVPVHEVGVDEEGRAYFTMKLVHGATLSEVIARHAAGDAEWSTARVLAVIQRVCDALAFAHGQGVIHRDLKPDNVMVGDFGAVYVMDWGLARRMSEPAEHVGSGAAIDELLAERTRDGHVLGTPAFMSPEQARGEVAAMGPPSDVYAIGAMLYELIAGRPPYTRPGEKASGSAILARVVAGPPARLVSPETPPELTAICEKAMARAVEARYPDVSELAADLRRFLEGRAVLARRTGPLARLGKWIRRNRAASAAIGAIAVALVFATVFGVQLRARTLERQFTTAFRRGEAVLATDWVGFGPEQLAKREAARESFARCTKLRRDDQNSWLRLAETSLRLNDGKTAREALVHAESLGEVGYYGVRLRVWLDQGADEAWPAAVFAGLPVDTSTWKPIDRFDRAFVLLTKNRYAEAYELVANLDEDAAASSPIVMGRMLRAQLLHQDSVADGNNQILLERGVGARLALAAYDAALRAAPEEPAIEYNRFLLLFDAADHLLETGLSGAALLADLDRYADERMREPANLEATSVEFRRCWMHVEENADRAEYARRGAELARTLSAEDVKTKLEKQVFVYLMQLLVVAGDYTQALERARLRTFEALGFEAKAGPLHVVVSLHRDLLGLLDPVPGRVEAFFEANVDTVELEDADAAMAVLEALEHPTTADEDE